MPHTPPSHPHPSPPRSSDPTPNNPTRQPKPPKEQARNRQNNPAIHTSARHLALPPSSTRKLPTKPLLQNLEPTRALALGRTRPPRPPNSYPPAPTNSRQSQSPSNPPHDPASRSLHLLPSKLYPHPRQSRPRQPRHTPRPRRRPSRHIPILQTGASAYIRAAPAFTSECALHLCWEVRYVSAVYARG
jgi:hypothetical protein